MSDVMVQVDGASKRYCRALRRSMWYGLCDVAAEWAGRTRAVDSLRPGEFWALRDVSFELRRGESLGLIGPNGAGKSTLLKLLGGLFKPDAGRLRIRGRVGSLIELGAGFHPLLSGRENVYVNGSILGLSTREIDARLERIVDFAEIGAAIDAPVRTYSSGMRARLGFAVAAHLDPDVLLIDEALAVGDVRFRMKCFDRLLQARRDGAALVLVSHSAVDIQRVASHVLLLAGGERRFFGPRDEGLTAYDRWLISDGATTSSEGRFRIQARCVHADDAARPIRSGDDVRLQLRLEMPLDARPLDVRFIVHLDSASGVRIGSFAVKAPDGGLIAATPPAWQGDFRLRRMPLAMGAYRLSVCVYGERFVDYLATESFAGSLEIAGPAPDPFGFDSHGLLRIEATPWEADGAAADEPGSERAS